MNLNFFRKIRYDVLIRSLPVIAGGTLGYLYYYFIGCSNGCAIQSNPYLSTLYGALVGFAFALPAKKKKSKDTAEL